MNEKRKMLAKITIDNSSDDSEDDLYTNFAGRLRALKKQRLIQEVSIQQRFSPKIDEEVNTDKEINGKEINNENVDINQLYDKNEIHDNNGIHDNNRLHDNELYDSEDDTEILEYGIQTRSRTRMHSPANDVQYIGTEISLIDDVTMNKPIPELYQNIILSDNDDNEVDDGALSEDDNYEIYIKVYWRSNRMDRLKLRRHDSFQQIFQHYANLENVSENEILIMKGDKSINRTDTPASLELTIVDILDGGIINPGMNTLTEDKITKDDNVCNIKIQTSSKKQSLTISLKRDQQFKFLFTKCAEQLGIKGNTLKFYFDGEQISPNDTPESLDIEGEACIDLHIST